LKTHFLSRIRGACLCYIPTHNRNVFIIFMERCPYTLDVIFWMSLYLVVLPLNWFDLGTEKCCTSYNLSSMNEQVFHSVHTTTFFKLHLSKFQVTNWCDPSSYNNAFFLLCKNFHHHSIDHAFVISEILS